MYHFATFLCNRPPNFKEFTKFGEKTQEVETSESRNFFVLNFCTPFRTKVMPVQKSDIMEKTGEPPDLCAVCIAKYNY